MSQTRWTDVPVGERLCVVAQGSPGAGRAEEVAASLLAHAAPLGEDVGLLVLCRGRAAPALRNALAPLEPVSEVLEREEAYPAARRLIGFAREEETR